ncbi:MAG: ABC transporter permease subunit [Leptolyngbyaceae cyanobacterium SL_7_1]|nr:ABC transporter permease subunit [Leptolyngbyaceae cyanobacterium SL_7_1]
MPEHRRQAGYAVGMTRGQVLRYVTLPAAAPAIFTGVLMALSQVVGETAALIAVGAAAFVSFVPDLSLSALQSGYTTLPTQIFYWATRPQAEFQGLAAATIIVLGAIVLVINVVAVFMRDLFYRR